MPLLALIFLFATPNFAQESDWPSLDKSPMDMIHYPPGVAWRNYLSGEDRNMEPQMKLIYSRPQKKERAIFGSLVPMGKEWRLGANQATEISFYQAVDFGGATVRRGTYTMFATLAADHWMITLSTQRNIWGAAKRDVSKNVATVKVMTDKAKENFEALSMSFQKVDEENANLIIGWDDTQVTVPINFNPVMFSPIDVSPLDQVMYPSSADGLNYVKADELDKNQPQIRVRYSRPQKKGREIFGGLLKYGEVWRVGANESTEITFYSDVNVHGTDVKSGTYNLYAVVNEQSWDLIFNKDMPAWGSANRDESKDVATVTIPVTQGKEDLEALGIIFRKKSDTQVDMVIGWGKTRGTAPITFKKN